MVTPTHHSINSVIPLFCIMNALLLCELCIFHIIIIVPEKPYNVSIHAMNSAGNGTSNLVIVFSQQGSELNHTF